MIYLNLLVLYLYPLRLTELEYRRTYWKGRPKLKNSMGKHRNNSHCLKITWHGIRKQQNRAYIKVQSIKSHKTCIPAEIWWCTSLYTWKEQINISNIPINFSLRHQVLEIDSCKITYINKAISFQFSTWISTKCQKETTTFKSYSRSCLFTLHRDRNLLLSTSRSRSSSTSYLWWMSASRKIVQKNPLMVSCKCSPSNNPEYK